MKFLIGVLYICILFSRSSYIRTENEREECLFEKYARFVVHLVGQYDDKAARKVTFWPGIIIAENKVLTSHCGDICQKEGAVYAGSRLGLDPHAVKIKIKHAINLNKDTHVPPQLSVVLLRGKFQFNENISSLILPHNIHRIGRKCIALTYVAQERPYFLKAREVKITDSCASGSFCFVDPDGGDISEYCWYSPVICNDEITGITDTFNCYKIKKIKLVATSVFEFVRWINSEIQKLDDYDMLVNSSNCMKMSAYKSLIFYIIDVLLLNFVITNIL